MERVMGKSAKQERCGAAGDEVMLNLETLAHAASSANSQVILTLSHTSPRCPHLPHAHRHEHRRVRFGHGPRRDHKRVVDVWRFRGVQVLTRSRPRVWHGVWRGLAREPDLDCAINACALARPRSKAVERHLYQNCTGTKYWYANGLIFSKLGPVVRRWSFYLRSVGWGGRGMRRQTSPLLNTDLCTETLHTSAPHLRPPHIAQSTPCSTLLTLGC